MEAAAVCHQNLIPGPNGCARNQVRVMTVMEIDFYLGQQQQWNRIPNPTITSTSSVNDNRWHNIVAQMSQKPARCLYIDGRLEAQADTPVVRGRIPDSGSVVRTVAATATAFSAEPSTSSRCTIGRCLRWRSRASTKPLRRAQTAHQSS